MAEERETPEKRDTQDKTFVAKIYTSALEFDYKYPWRAPSLASWSGSGFILGGNRLVTNAHVAGGAVHMEVQLAGDSKRYTASLKHIANECDLAQLEIEDEEFWEKTKACEIADTPEREEKVRVVGFPMGGTTVSYTKGIVSRMEVDSYAQSGRELMTTQIDAAINPGNSGGPVINSDGDIVGVAFQGFRGAQLLGYMIPANVLKHFLNQVEAEEKGFPELAIEVQNIESSYLHDHFKLPEDKSGVVINKIKTLSPCKGVLKEGDIILEVDGIPVNGDGTVFINPAKKIDYEHIIQNKAVGDDLTFKVWRNGQEMDKTVHLDSALGATETVIPMESGKRPSYYILAGQIVVQPVTENFMQATRRAYKNEEKQEPDDQLLAINTFLKSGYTNGYRGLDGDLISEVNGKAVRNMKDLVWAVECNDLETHVIKTKSGETVVIPNLSFEKQDEILDRYYISKDRSDDLPPRADSCCASHDIEEPEVEEEKADDASMFFSGALLDFLGGAAGSNDSSSTPTDSEDLSEESMKAANELAYQNLARASARPH